MNKALNEIQELWDNGHAEALTQFGMLCAENAVDGYKRGSFYGTCIGTAIGVATTLSTIYLVSTIRRKYFSNKD